MVAAKIVQTDANNSAYSIPLEYRDFLLKGGASFSSALPTFATKHQEVVSVFRNDGLNVRPKHLHLYPRQSQHFDINYYTQRNYVLCYVVRRIFDACTDGGRHCGFEWIVDNSGSSCLVLFFSWLLCLKLGTDGHTSKPNRFWFDAIQ